MLQRQNGMIQVAACRHWLRRCSGAFNSEPKMYIYPSCTKHLIHNTTFPSMSEMHHHKHLLEVSQDIPVSLDDTMMISAIQEELNMNTVDSSAQAWVLAWCYRQTLHTTFNAKLFLGPQSFSVSLGQGS